MSISLSAGILDNADDERIVAKTRTQLNRRLGDAKKLPWPPFGKAWYAGCTTLIIGNSLKAGIRKSPNRMAKSRFLIPFQGSWRSTSIRPYYRMQRGRYQALGPSLQVSARESQSPS